MSLHDETTVVIRRHEFEEVRTDVKAILERLNANSTKSELHENRIHMLERVVYGGVGLILIAVGGSIIALTVHK
jgi:hypothetical protein